MILIKADHDRRIAIPGVPLPVRRPVDVDQAKTGFTVLRTLRIYRFDKESVIEGHAEEDEVFIVVIAGAVELTVTDRSTTLGPLTLSAADGAEGIHCAAYLPPGAAYKLIPKTGADVAYARATPSGIRPVKVFCSVARPADPGVTVLLEEVDHAERLRLRVIQCDGRERDVVFAPLQETGGEALVHIRTPAAESVAVVSKTQADPVWLESWDTVAAAPSDSVALHIAKRSLVLALIVMTT